jgi:hypothetical protein
MQMLSSFVLSFFIGRLSLLPEQSKDPIHIYEKTSWRFRLLELALFSMLLFSAAAVIWIVGPLEVHIVNFYSPNLASHLDLDLPRDSSSAEMDWLLVKRVMIGYFSLCIVCFVAFVFWAAVEIRFLPRAKQSNALWTIVLEESDDE